MDTDSFLPSNYTLPNSSNGYMKLEEGANRFRIVSHAIVGYEFWEDTENKKTVKRFRIEDAHPADSKHFWAFVVWNYKASRFQILNITQKLLQGSINSLVQDEDWGSPRNYDLVITKSGEGKNNVRYEVSPKPKKPLDSEIVELWKKTKPTIDLDKLFEGGNPFSEQQMSEDKKITKSSKDSDEEELNKLFGIK